MNDNHVTRRVYSRTDGRGVPKPKAPRICTWDGCDQPAFHFIPVCYDHGQTISEVFAPPSGDGVQATLLAEAEFNKRLLERERQRREVRELRASRGNQPGWIYYVHTDGKVKIGYSTDITRRLRAYPPGSEVLAVHPGTLELERSIHRDFDAHRVAGREWFRPAPEILDHFATVRDQYGDPTRFAPKVRDPHDGNRVVAGKRTNRRW